MQNKAKRKRIRKKAKQRRIVILKDILILLVIQVIVLLLISPWGATQVSEDVNAEILQYETIVAEERGLIYPWFSTTDTPTYFQGRGSRVYVLSNGTKYEFPFISGGNKAGLSYAKLYRAVEAGDQLVVGYLVDGDECIIYFCEEDGEVYRSVEGYNHFLKNQRVCLIICFCIAELFWLAFSVFRIYFIWIIR